MEDNSSVPSQSKIRSFCRHGGLLSAIYRGLLSHCQTFVQADHRTKDSTPWEREGETESHEEALSIGLDG